MIEIYLDNSATTKVYEPVADLMKKIMCQDYGNPSSAHHKGVEAEKYIKKAAATFAALLKVQEKEIYFTSGGTESDNMAIIGGALANRRRGKHLITTVMEHPAVLKTMVHMEEEGYEVTYLPVDARGIISPEELKNALRPDTILVSIMHVNNEIGSVQPIWKAGEVIRAYNREILFHVDAVQGFGKYRIFPKKLGVDMLSVSGHKIHGPKGTGVLYVNQNTKIQPIIFGGGQQKDLRSGTENVPGIAGIAMAAEMAYDHLDEKMNRVRDLRDLFIDGLTKIPGTIVHGADGADSAPHIVSAGFSGVRSEVLLHALEAAGIYVSAGSACATNHPQISGVLRGIGVSKEYLNSTLRFSFSEFTRKEEIERALEVLEKELPVLRRYTRH